VKYRASPDRRQKLDFYRLLTNVRRPGSERELDDGGGGGGRGGNVCDASAV